MTYPRSPYHTVGGIVYFGRMADKIRMNAEGTLPDDLKANLGVHFDTRCCVFLGVEYPELVKRTLAGGNDEALLAWCFAQGRRPSGEEVEVWNGFMTKRGWRDEGAATLARRKSESGFTDRDDIMTMFDYIDADEDRSVKKWK